MEQQRVAARDSKLAYASRLGFKAGELLSVWLQRRQMPGMSPGTAVTSRRATKEKPARMPDAGCRRDADPTSLCYFAALLK
jgi:hypothetical protein